MKIIIATHNEGKLKEFKKLLPNYEILGLKDLNYNDEIEENGTSFQENSLIKAKTIYDIYKIPVLSDDSGLCVKALNNEPGIYSARYRNLATFDEKMDYILKHIDEQRDAHFNATLCYYDKEPIFFEGILHGKIANIKSGINGFGYDPIFIPNEYKTTLSEISMEDKNKISHRALAIQKFLNYLKTSNK